MTCCVFFDPFTSEAPDITSANRRLQKSLYLRKQLN
jgi:hypothetical protein